MFSRRRGSERSFGAAKDSCLAGDDDHRHPNNPGRAKALEAAAAVKGVAIFPQSSAEQREQGMTDFNDLGQENPEVVATQFQDALKRVREQGKEREFGGEMEKGILCMDGWASRTETRCVIVKETAKRLLIRLEEDCMMWGGRWKTKGEEVYVPKYAIRRELAASMELAR